MAEALNNKGIALTEDGGVYKIILKEGSDTLQPEKEFIHPPKGCEVKVHYVGTLESNGEEFDSSVRRNEPFGFTLGNGSVIKGWDIAVATMKFGEKSKVTIRSDYAYGESGSGDKIPGGATLVFEIELLDWTEGEDISPEPSAGQSIFKTILVEASDKDAWQKPKDGSQATVNYVLKYFKNDEVLEEKKSFVFVVGEEQVSEGLEFCIKTMKKGEKSKFRITKPSLYGRSDLLGANQSKQLSYEVELVDFINPRERWDMLADEKIAYAENKRLEGNEFFKANRLNMAKKRYDVAIDYINSDYDFTKAEDKEQVKKIKAACYTNLAQVLSKEEKWKQVIEKATKALELEHNNIKALFRRGQAYYKVSDFDAAHADVKKALELDPSNTALQQEITRIKAKLKEQEEKEKKVFAKMFL